MLKIHRVLCLGLLSWGWITAVQAHTLNSAYAQARQHDATFATAQAEYAAARIQARLAASAYYPEFKISATQLDSENGTRHTFSVQQPILSADRWLALQEADPRFALAEVSQQKSQIDLALRLFKAVAAYSEAREKLVLNEASQEALKLQAASAKKTYELGQGTVTDVYDTELRLTQAQSQGYVLQANFSAAQRDYATVVGELPVGGHYRLLSQTAMPALQDLNDYMDRALHMNPALQAAVWGTRLGEIGAQRSKAAYLPQVVASAVQSKLSGSGATSNSAGVVLRLDAPLQASSYLNTQTAAANLLKVQEQERDTRQKVALEVERLYNLVQASANEVAMRRQAIQAAELSVKANEQSFAGGVRSQLDVLNALQMRFQAQSDYVTALLQLGSNWLQLQLTAAEDVETALQQVQSLVFEP